MKKIATTFFVLLIYYALPLAGNLSLLGHWKVIVLMLTCILIWMTQPALTIEDSTKHRSADRMTVWIILILALLTNSFSLMEWAYYQKPQLHGVLNSTHWLGLLLIIGGLFLRILAIRTLDKFFTATVHIKDDHRLVTKGVYAFLRHPSYTGAYLCYLGTALWLGAWVGLIVATVLMGIAYYVRIQAEERALEGQFGEAYELYRQRTWIMVPGVW
ncbi:MAG: isoprenylcysteine carboxylmethyltransferase family protein [Saprospiraceae bacterium]|nr:isoprenylcysteine carboxylmethyltransferase family protein [Saprospiraceae bacterium]